jgi:hypothetical protein
LIYGNPRNWPEGKPIGSQNLSKVILETRNQSIHADEARKNGKFNKIDVATCFNTLEELNPVFSDYLKCDMAFEVIKVLGWTSYEKYRADMLTLK